MKTEEKQEELFVAERDGCGVRKGQPILKRIKGKWQLAIWDNETYEQALLRLMTLPDGFSLLCPHLMESPSMDVVRIELRRQLSANPDQSPLSIPGLPSGRLVPNLEQMGRHWLNNGLLIVSSYVTIKPEDLDYQLASIEFNESMVTLHYKQATDKPAAPDVHVWLEKCEHYWKPRKFRLDSGPGCLCGYCLQYVDDSNHRHHCGL